MTTATPKFRPGQLTVHRDPAEFASVARALRSVGRKIALVPTMGALHAGHRELISRAKRIPGVTVGVSLFVNPLQFGPNEDFDRYPRAFDDDIALCAAAGAELVFAPQVEQMYPDGPNKTTVSAGALGAVLEGHSRPGHFDGVLTVVAKLLNIARPDYAFFGEKDYQQLVLIKRMVRELNMDTHVVGVPTVRESDGLAMSSRNAYVQPHQRDAAMVLSAALVAGASVSAGGAEVVLDTAHEVLATRPELEVDYLQLCGLDLGDPPAQGDARLLVAARLGDTRLIDNVAVLLGPRPADEK